MEKMTSYLHHLLEIHHEIDIFLVTVSMLNTLSLFRDMFCILENLINTSHILDQTSISLLRFQDSAN